MPKSFKRGDHVEWNSEAGRVRGVIVKKVVSDTRVKGYIHHASKNEAQYIIKGDKTDRVAIHKGRALKRLKAVDLQAFSSNLAAQALLSTINLSVNNFQASIRA